ncbi:MAG: hypothetical protein M3T49_02805 [Candidatus Eremiobacteraeota bacterium]|nr:hypothetical protein [Candidatus Eremiobacteraeota bacterium]
MSRYRIFVASAAWAIALSLAGPRAQAHPLGNFTVNHLTKVAIHGDAMQLRYVLDVAEIPTFQIVRALDRDAKPSAAQLRGWASSEVGAIQSGLSVEQDGRTLALRPRAVRVSTRPGAGGLALLYLVADFDVRLRAGSMRHIGIADKTFAERIGWKDIVVAPASEPTAELQRYPSALLASPRDVTAVRITLNASRQTVEALQAGDAGGGGPSQLRTNALSDMLAHGTANPLLVMLTLLVAMGLGALHAAEPGHGKTLLAVSLIGARATTKQAIILATGLTFSHTVGVIALGIVLLFASQRIVPENVYPWITVVSGMMVAFIGAGGLARYVHARSHAHASAHHHDHEHPHGHVIPGTQPLSFRSVVVMAMSGNIAPCPAALVVLLTALSLHRTGYGIVVILAFSIGLAAVLVGLGIGLIHGAKWLAQRPALDRLIAYGPLASACMIACIGAIMIGQGFAAGSLHAPIAPVVGLALAAIAGYALRPGHTHTHGAPLMREY